MYSLLSEYCAEHICPIFLSVCLLCHIRPGPPFVGTVRLCSRLVIFINRLSEIIQQVLTIGIINCMHLRWEEEMAEPRNSLKITEVLLRISHPYKANPSNHSLEYFFFQKIFVEVMCFCFQWISTSFHCRSTHFKVISTLEITSLSELGVGNAQFCPYWNFCSMMSKFNSAFCCVYMVWL